MSHGQDIPEATEENPTPDLNLDKPLPIIVRATNGKGKKAREEKKKLKISTIVEADALGDFYARYADICKTGMTALKPRDRSKKKAKARKKKGGAA